MSSSDQQQSSASCPPPLPRLSWFLLVDSETGEPYKNSSVSAIKHSSLAVPVVAQFRDAVHVENPNTLRGIVPSQLVVYKNKAAFDRRNNAQDQGKEQPLKASRNLDGLGETEEEALVVVVPPPSQPPYLQTTQTQSYPPCQHPFFNSISKVTERDGWISFGLEEIPSTSLKSLYIRECYRPIASSILQANGIHKAIITGTPGIGKSFFLIYLLWRLVKEGKRVLFINRSFNIYYDGNGGVFRFVCGHLPLQVNHRFWNATLWCLFDAKFKTDSDFFRLPLGLSTFILSTSPRGELVNDFKKPPVPQVFYMPTWTEAELEAIAPSFPEANDKWRDRFTILGGIPRDVLEDTTKTPTVILEAACKDCSLDDCIREIGLNSIIVDKSKAIHSLVHITSIPPFTKSSVCYASSTALDIIVQRKGIKARHKWRELLGSCEGNPLASALCRCIFELYAIELLERGGNFTCRRLVGHGNTNIQPIETTLDIPPSKKVVIDKVLPDQTLDQLYVPKTKNCAAIDAWIPGIGAFQMAVGMKHGIKGGAKDDLAQLGRCNRLYWLLPPIYYDSFTKKLPRNIDQYAILLPYPE